MSHSEITGTLARFVATSTPGSWPDAVRRECTRALVNGVGCMVGGSSSRLFDVACRALGAFSGPPAATVMGGRGRADILSTALFNGLAGAAFSFDDTYSDALLHPTGPVIAAVLALSEHRVASGAELLHALGLGIEVSCRLIRMLSAPPAKLDLAWSATGIACGIGASVAAGRLLRLDPPALENAIGISASEASGTRVTHGSMAASLIFGHAAQTGLRAALLAEAGFTSTAGSIEKRYGFAQTFAEDADMSAIASGLGSRFELLANTYKPYPCAIVIHPVLDALLALKRDPGFSASEVVRIVVKVPPRTVTLSHRPVPRNEVEAKQSLEHWAAAAVVAGKAGLREGSQETVDDADIARIRTRVEVVGDGTMSSGTADVVVELATGRRLHEVVSEASGSLTRPMTDDMLSRKFLDQAEPVLGRERAERLLELCWSVSDVGDAASLARAAA